MKADPGRAPRWFIFVPPGRPGSGRWAIPAEVTDRVTYAEKRRATRLFCESEVVARLP